MSTICIFILYCIRLRCLGEEQLTRFTICSLCILSIRNVSFFAFDDRCLILIVPVPGHCLS